MLAGVFGVGAVGDKVLRQFVELGRGKRLGRRWRHRRQIGVTPGVARRQILAVWCGLRVGVVGADANPAAIGFDRMAAAERQQQHQDRFPPNLGNAAAEKAAVLAFHHNDKPGRLAGRPGHRCTRANVAGRCTFAGCGVLDRLRPVTTFDRIDGR